MGYITNEVARTTASAAAQRVLMHDPAARAQLLRNPFLSDETFAELYQGLSAAEAKTLLSLNTLNEFKFDTVLAREKRTTVAAAMLDWDLTPERLDKLLTAKAFSRKLSDALVENYNALLSIDWLARAAELVGGRARLELWLRTPEAFTDQEISDHLQAYAPWGPTSDSNRIGEVIEQRPAVIAGAARSDGDRVRTAAAKSRYITNVADQLAVLGLESTERAVPRDAAWIKKNVYTLMALANNPVTAIDVVRRCDDYLQRAEEPDHQDSARNRLQYKPGSPVSVPYEQEDDAAKLAWLLNRCLPSDHGPARHHDLVALLRNPHLSDGDLHLIRRRVSQNGDLEDQKAANAAFARHPEYVEQFGLLTIPETVPCNPPRDTREQVLPGLDDLEWGVRSDVQHIRNGGAALRALEAGLGDDDGAWAIALALLENGFPGTVSEFLTVTGVVFEPA